MHVVEPGLVRPVLPWRRPLAPGSGRPGTCGPRGRRRRTSVDAVGPLTAVRTGRCAGRAAGPLDDDPRQRPATWWVDRLVVDVHGAEIGTVVASYGDAGHGAVRWLGIDAGGLDALQLVIAPIDGARCRAGVVVVAFERTWVLETSRAVVSMLAAAIDGEVASSPSTRRAPAAAAHLDPPTR